MVKHDGQRPWGISQFRFDPFVVRLQPVDALIGYWMRFEELLAPEIAGLSLRDALISTDGQVSVLANTVLRLQHAIRGQFNLPRTEDLPAVDEDGTAVARRAFLQLVDRASRASWGREIQTFSCAHGMSAGQFRQARARLTHCMGSLGKRFVNVLSVAAERPCWIIVGDRMAV